jgi:1,4-alpha-glucan branching enzyme
MPASLEQISESTPMGANLTGSGATFRVWAPHAHRVHACVNGAAADDTNLLKVDQPGHWRGFSLECRTAIATNSSSGRIA